MLWCPTPGPVDLKLQDVRKTHNRQRSTIGLRANAKVPKNTVRRREARAGASTCLSSNSLRQVLYTRFRPKLVAGMLGGEIIHIRIITSFHMRLLISACFPGKILKSFHPSPWVPVRWVVTGSPKVRALVGGYNGFITFWD